MIRVIDRRRYNTDKAEIIGEWTNGHYRSDFHFCAETLQRTINGNYFIYCRGGALSAYAESCGNMTGAGERIVPLSRDEALDWAERHLDGETVAEEFRDSVIEA